jgi:hypothetical protein
LRLLEHDRDGDGIDGAAQVLLAFCAHQDISHAALLGCEGEFVRLVAAKKIVDLVALGNRVSNAVGVQDQADGNVLERLVAAGRVEQEAIGLSVDKKCQNAKLSRSSFNTIFIL